jgi:hypothetical protein
LISKQEVALSNGRKGKGTSLFAVKIKPNSDPCLQAGLDFPAFAYYRNSNTQTEFLVADSSGQCSRPVITVESGGSEMQFSYPVAENTGRLIWEDRGAVVGVDFTVQNTGYNITVGTPFTLYSENWIAGLAKPQLSQDGQTVYLVTSCQTVSKLSADGSGLLVPLLTTGADVCIGSISVTRDESAIYADVRDMTAARWMLVRFDVDATGVFEVLEFTDSITEVAADPYSDRIAYKEMLLNTKATCPLLVIKDTATGYNLDYGQPAYGFAPTWLDGGVLLEGYYAPNHSGSCHTTGDLVRLDPSSGAQTHLTAGYQPDGR